MLVGLKTDQRVEGTPDVNSGKVEPVTPEDGAALAKAINAVSYREASAKTRDGVHAVFDVAIDAIMSERFPAPPPEAAKQVVQINTNIATNNRRKQQKLLIRQKNLKRRKEVAFSCERNCISKNRTLFYSKTSFVWKEISTATNY